MFNTVNTNFIHEFFAPWETNANDIPAVHFNQIHYLEFHDMLFTDITLNNNQHFHPLFSSLFPIVHYVQQYTFPTDAMFVYYCGHGNTLISSISPA